MKLGLSKDRTRLFEKAERWDFVNSPLDVIDFSQSMVDLMWSIQGATGLAGNQLDTLGKYNVFCMQGINESYVCFNPKIVNPSVETVELEEGSVSYPGFTYDKIRPRHIRVRFTAPNGEVFTRQFTGLTARIIQILMDHLEGVPPWSDISALKFDISLRKAKKLGFDYSYFPLKKSSIILP